MRLRNVRGAREEMLVNPSVIQEPASHRGHFRELFQNQNPLHIEVGMGKGQFLCRLSEKHPEINYIGIEKYSSVLIRAIEKRDRMQQEVMQGERDPFHLLFIRTDAELLPEIFGEGEVARIYLNFSDPWPKDRHAKRRLTSPAFLERYRRVLAPDGLIEFKTDNQELFAYSLETIRECGCRILYETKDLHHSSYAEDNVMTEYEEKFAGMGKPICKVAFCL